MRRGGFDRKPRSACRPDRGRLIITELPLPDQQRRSLIERSPKMVNEQEGSRHLPTSATKATATACGIVIETRGVGRLPQRGASNNLFKAHPPARATSAPHMLALVNSEPIFAYPAAPAAGVPRLSGRKTIERRHPATCLRKGREPTTFLLGLLRALDQLDPIHRPDSRRGRLRPQRGSNCRRRHGLSEIQFRTPFPGRCSCAGLTALEANKIRAWNTRIWLPRSPTTPGHPWQGVSAVSGLIGLELKQAARVVMTPPAATRSSISEGGLEDIDLMPTERSVVLLTETGYLKRMAGQRVRGHQPGNPRQVRNPQARGEEGRTVFISCKRPRHPASLQ